MRRKRQSGRELLFDSLERRELLATYRWLGTSTSNGLYDWNLAANWSNEDAAGSPGVPGQNDTARILGGNQVYLSTDITVGSLIVGQDFRDQGHQIHTQGYTLTFGGGAIDGGWLYGSFANTGVLTVNALTGAQNWPLTLTGGLTNSGTLTLQSGQFRTSLTLGGFPSGSTIVNAPEGTIRVAAGATLGGGLTWSGRIENGGTIVKDDSPGTGIVGMPTEFLPGSTLRVDAGILQLTGNDHRFAGGSIHVAAQAELEIRLDFIGGTSTEVTAATVVSGPGAVRVRRGEIALNSSLRLEGTRFILESADDAQNSRISGTGSLESGTIDVRKGWLYFATLTNRGDVQFSGQGIGDAELYGSTLINEGSVGFDAPDIVIAESSITNTASGTIDILRGGQLRYGIFQGYAFNFREWRNLGTIRQHEGVEGFSISLVQFINLGGTIQVDDGVFDLSVKTGVSPSELPDVTSRDATFVVAPGATLDWHADGAYHGFGGTFTATGGGTVLLGATAYASADDLVLQGDPGMFRLRETGGWYGRIENRTDVSIEGSNGQSIRLLGDMVNLGTLRVNSLLYLNSPSAGGLGRLFNEPGATIETAPGVYFIGGGLGNSDFSDNTGPLIHNEGRIAFGGSLTVNAKLDNLGSIELAGDTLLQGLRGPDIGQGRLGLTGDWLIHQGAQFRSTAVVRGILGTFRLDRDASAIFPGQLTNSGRISLAPGSALRANQGYAQTAAGALAVALAGPGQFGRLLVTGTTELAGSLEVNLDPGYTPASETTFEILTATTLQGGFDSYVAPRLVPAYTGTSVILGRNLFAGDLVVEDVQILGVSGPLMPKQPFQVRYTVRNDSDATVSGPWSDIIHLAHGETRGLDAVRIGVSGATASLSPHQTATITVDLFAPSLPGTWNVFVTTDRHGVIPDLDRSNNIGRSTTSLGIVLPELALGAPASINLDPGETYYYVLQVPVGAGPIRVSTDFAAIDAGQIRVVRALAYDASGSEWNAQSQATQGGRQADIDLIDGVAGTYYIAVTSRSGGTVTTTADRATLAINTYDGIDQIRHDLYAGDTLTLTLRGAGFTAGTEFRLGGRAASTTTILDPSTAVVSFANLAPGDDLRIEAALGSNTAVAPGAGFRVLNQTATPVAALASWATFVDMPQYSRPSREIPVTIRFRNDSGVSQPPPLLLITTNNGSFRLATESVFRGSQIGLLGVKSTGRPDLFLPGETGSIDLVLLPTTSGNGVVSEVVAAVMGERQAVPGVSGATQPISLRLGAIDDFRPATISTQAWNGAVRANLLSLLGNTVESYANALRSAAARLAPDQVDTRDAARLITYLVQVADDFGAISARFQSSAFGLGRSNPYDIRITADLDGNLLVRAGSRVRSFRKQNGAYVGLNSDEATIVPRSGGGWVLAETDGTHYGFRADGLWDYTEDARGRRMTTTYVDGRLTTITDASGQTVTLSYNAAGLITAVTDPEGDTTTYHYDAAGRFLTSVVTPYSTTSFESSNATSGPNAYAITRMVDSAGVTWDYEYDAFGRLSRVSRNGGQLPVQIQHGAGASLAEMTIVDPAGATTMITRGEFGQLTELIDATGARTDYEYDRQGLLMAVRGPGGIAVLERDSQGLITALLSAAGIELQLSYEGTNAQPATIADPLGRLSRFSHDATGLPTSWTQPDGKTTSFELDAAGRVVRIADAAGNEVHRTLDARGDLSRIDYSDESYIVYTRDANHRVVEVAETSAAGVTQRVAFSYDATGRLASTLDAAGRLVRYEYDTFGRAFRTVADGVVIETTFDDLSRPSTILRNGVLELTYTYDTAGNLASRTYGNGTKTVYSYDVLGRVARIENLAASGGVLDFEAYVRDASERIATVTTLEGTTTYEYDARNQLIGVQLPDGTTRRYDVDAVGNRLGYTTDSGNRYLTDSDGRQFQYDSLGNLVAVVEPDGETATYEYDARSRLVRISRPGVESTFEYDPLGNRSAVIQNGVRTERLIDPFGSTGLSDVLAEYNADGSLRTSYLIADSLVARFDAAGNPDYYHFDLTGNTTILTDASGQVDATYAYLPFGETLEESGPAAADNPYTFQGQWGGVDHGDGLYELRARFLDAALGRFTQPDPSGLAGGDVNLYRYVRNNPQIYIDPTGLDPTIKPEPKPSPNPKPIEPITPNPKPGDKPQEKPDKGGGGGDTITPPPQEGEPYNPDTHPSEFTPSEEIGDGDGGGESLPNFDPADWPQKNQAPEPWYYDPLVIGGGILLVGLAGAAIFFSGGTATPVVAEVAAPVIGEVVSGGLSYYGRRAIVAAVVTKTVSGETLTEQAPVPGGRSFTTQIVPRDPNDITGPGGFGEALHRQPGGTYGYTINFQNRPDASAPAQEVVVTQQLDADLDWDTFELSSFGWGDHVFHVPAGQQSYFTRVEDAARNLVVEISAVFNAATGTLTWTFRSLDPVSLDVPADALAGFLLPDDDTGRGQGFISYTIQPDEGALTGMTYDARASIVFDTEAPLVTNVHSNAVDNTPPTASVDLLPPSSPSTFQVRWIGSDAGSGVQSYDVLVKEGDGEWRLWLDDTTATSATFTGTPGVTYQFDVIATDGVTLRSAGSAAIAATQVELTTSAPVTPPIEPPVVIPGIEALVIDDGSAQRSRVQTIELTFNTLVHLAPGAIQLTRRDGRAVPLNLAVGATPDGRTVVRITFRGPQTSRGSLRDGLYKLLVRGDLIQDATGRSLDGDGDGRSGGDRRASFHRLFGDNNGNGRLDARDFRAMRRTLSRPRPAHYIRHLDVNADGRSNATDIRAFGARLARRFPVGQANPKPASR